MAISREDEAVLTYATAWLDLPPKLRTVAAALWPRLAAITSPDATTDEAYALFRAIYEDGCSEQLDCVSQLVTALSQAFRAA